MTTLAPLIETINGTMARLIAEDDKIVGRVSGYSLAGGGKRLRPLIFCLTAEAAGVRMTPELYETASSFELLHMATLLHDDIVDMAAVRRGLATAHLTFGVPETVLAGDYLLAKAAGLVARTGNMDCVRIATGVVAALSLGELMQLGSRRKTEQSETDYFRIIYRKTAALIEGAAKNAAILAEVSPEARAQAARYGRKLGLAFQIMDDILDYQGDQAALGKPVGQDLAEGNITLPFIRAREALAGAPRERLCELASRPDLNEADRAEILALVAAGGGLTSSRLTADELAREAVTCLKALPATEARDRLEALALYAVKRDR
ncbi:MAG: polyprenyl synthetase family protein [Candidatus Adiutrix sp.]|nr:polyprenyl synthetase family protein [Candidatus Adiutrix sp.]